MTQLRIDCQDHAELRLIALKLERPPGA